MGREIRLVPKDWQHPKNKNGTYIPLFKNTYEEELALWEKDKELFEQGIWKPYIGEIKELPEEAKTMTFEQWCGEHPDPKDHMPKFDDPPTHFQLYENTTEGTPVSPVFETKEELGEWIDKQ